MQRQLFTDQLGRAISLPFPPKRIISLVPSQTELLFDLDLDEEVIGITKFCIHPVEKYKSVAKIGGTKQLDLDKIRQLKPDLIIGNKEENEKSQIEQLMQEFPVWMSEVNDLGDALNMIKQIGALVGKTHQAEQLVKEIYDGFAGLKALPSFVTQIGEIKNQKSEIRIAYFIWKNPYMVASKDTFIDDMIKQAGWKNAFELNRYPEISTANLREAAPDVIFLSSEPYPFKEKHLLEFKEICPNSKVMIVDGELLCWYGSRLRHTPAYLQSLLIQINNQN